ncbi:hypothetical protein OROHE_012927 [Orobanche hederae]
MKAKGAAAATVVLNPASVISFDHKSEEEERSDRWHDFLGRQCESAQLAVSESSEYNNVIKLSVKPTDSITADDSSIEDYKETISTWRRGYDEFSCGKEGQFVKDESHPDPGVRKQLPVLEEARPGKGTSEEDSEEEFYDLERSESDPSQEILSADEDLPRTFPGHPALDEDGRNALRRLLTAYARHNLSVGYCQFYLFAGSHTLRLHKIVILCNMLRTVMEITPKDLLPFVYILANRIAPAHQGLELGIGDASIIRALAESCGASESTLDI